MDTLSTFQKELYNREWIFESQEQQLYQLISTYLELFPVEDAYLLRYSPIGHLAEGIIYIDNAGGKHIGEIREDIRSFPIIHHSIQQRKAMYCHGADYLQKVSLTHSIPSTTNFLLVTPIFSYQAVFGYICSSKLLIDTSQIESYIEHLTFFGKFIGSLFQDIPHNSKHHKLSKRELEVMIEVANGNSSKEIATLYSLSEVTVNQYIKSALKKLHATNRSHAISELYKRKILLS